MELFKQILLHESHKAAVKELSYVTQIINKCYSEWNAVKRRKNAIDLETSTANRLSNISVGVLDRLHDSTKLKLATLLVRCMDIPSWKPVETKARTYKKLYHLINHMRSEDPNTGTGGTVQEIIATRLSASVCYGKDVFVAYETLLSKSYLKYLFGDFLPKKTYRMQILNLPDDFDSLVKTLQVNLEKCEAKFKSE
jgi:hypothetical protein